MKSRSESGVALVITLIMLSVVTLMALTFLAVSRRERSSVVVTEEGTTAKLMAESGLARAEAELVGQMLARSNLLAWDMIVSTNYISPGGFEPASSGLNVTNVNYDFVRSGGRLSPDQWLRNIANLEINPRAPVFIRTNQNPTTPLDFRFFLDLNRNGQFETNGWVLDQTTLPRAVRFYTGDPEWIAVLQDPDLPHSGTNRFVGRYAFLVLPAGRTLDWNFIHNNARLANFSGLGYYRNQGYGSWELNLSAFFRTLNTNVWRDYGYRGLASVVATDSTLDALNFLRYRYARNYDSLARARNWFGPRASEFQRDYIDGYSDGPDSVTTDNDQPDRPWAGSDNPTNYFELTDLFNTNKVPVAWLRRWTTPAQPNLLYNRYTFYRMLGQIGTESVTASRGKINLNYNNLLPNTETNLVAWTSTNFFNAAANRMFESTRITNIVRTTGGQTVTNYLIGDTLVGRTFSVEHINLWPVNEYTPTIHRLLQLAVNIYDANTTRTLSSYPYLPTVLRPVFKVAYTNNTTNVWISGYVEVTSASFLNNATVHDLYNPIERAALAGAPNPIVYDVPFLIGAKKGFPNFNEFTMQNIAQVSRKIELRKRADTDRIPFQTNQMYLIGVSNQFGIECWNSYTQDFRRPLTMRVAGEFRLMLTNSLLPNSTLRWTNLFYRTNLSFSTWRANQFVVPVTRNVLFVPESVYQPFPRPNLVRAGTNDIFQAGGFYVPQWDLVITNRFYYALVDDQSDRIVDFVSFGNMTGGMNLTSGIMGSSQLGTSEPANVWLTNRIGGSLSVTVPTYGVYNQMRISLGEEQVSDQQWASYSHILAEGQDKEKSIDRFRVFSGLSPIYFTSEEDVRRTQADLRGKLAMQAPYAPTRKVYQTLSWQVNDPLVHYLVEDLLDPQDRPDNPARSNSVRFAVPPQIQITNPNLYALNGRYRPWGGNPNQSSDPLATDPRVKDPLIQRSDDWEFPTNKFPNIGWLGRVHRGTPWQTIYLKSGLVPTNAWAGWAGSYGTHPTNDWRLLDAFTIAPNDNSARGLLSVNQSGLGAWSAVLAGITVLTNTTPITGPRTNTSGVIGTEEMWIEPETLRHPQLHRIVDGINHTRSLETNLVAGGQGIPEFDYMGRLLATPELTLASPFINTNNLVNDEILERIPQQILSLVKQDDTRFVIYSFGQTLREAPNSLSLGGAYNRMCTNYEVKAEFATRAVIRVEGSVRSPRVVVESYNESGAE